MIVLALLQPVLRIVRFTGIKVLGVYPVDTSILYAELADAIFPLSLLPIIGLWKRYIHHMLNKYTNNERNK